ncbi:DUF1573 domain-containing protein [Reichenbachiella versicolor]|uniref:DUF1573 domain-containing protein n=1 Tax=Reichenbachiella versicolor TaxID=1821036 RepID=UPI000D6E7B89|nr:DUF1573 domain-containing protein [Reichenbachiella versicolor]
MKTLSVLVVLVTTSFQFLLAEKPSNSSLIWESKTHNFGKIVKGNPVTKTFNFVNENNQSIQITKSKGSCGCTVTSHTTNEILPGESGQVTAKYNAAKIGTFNKSILVYTNINNEPIKLIISGEVTD